jgi:hypothetical protein
MRNVSEPAGRRKALAKRFGLVTFAVLALALPATGQERTKPAPTLRDYIPGPGAIGCNYIMLLYTQILTADCGWARGPADDSIDEAIAAIDDWIVANSYPPPTRPMLEDLKRRGAENFRSGLTRQQYCEGHNAKFLGAIRDADPDQIRAAVKQLLSTPRELMTMACF